MKDNLSSDLDSRRAGAAARIIAGIAGLAVLGTAAVAPAPAQAVAPSGAQTLVRTFAQGSLDWTVPAATYSVSAAVVGGSGAAGTGAAGSSGGAGGHGAVVVETLAVHPGETLALYPGAAATDHAGAAGYGSSYGGNAATSDTNQNGGGGGAASSLVLNDVFVAVAGGGGGGGGGGAIYSYGGGNGGDAPADGAGGSGYGAGSGGTGHRVVTGANDRHGAAASAAPDSSFAGGGGGGGAGWDGGSLSGGSAGASGGYGGGGGGGGAGGESYGASPAASITVASWTGDGYVSLSWTPGVDNTSTLTESSDTVVSGTPITFTDRISTAVSNAPSAAGTVTFYDVDLYGASRTALATVPVTNGAASYTTTSIGAGLLGYHAIQAVYNGDANYLPSNSNYVYPNVIAAIKTTSLSPASLAFGNQAVGKLVTKTVTLTNTGNITWVASYASTNDGTVNMPATTCSTLAPGQSCSITVSYQPNAAVHTSAKITMFSNFGSSVIHVTGTGIVAPTVTSIKPASGPTAGGTRVTITGTGFTAVTAIKIGAAAMTSVNCSSSTTCTATTPAGTGRQNIRVVTSHGTSDIVVADRFTYTG